MPEEAVALWDVTRGLGDAAGTIVEIGSWRGKSSVVIGSALKGRKGARLYCVDPFDASGTGRTRRRYAELTASMDLSLLEEFRRNIRRAGLADLVQPLQGLSHEVAKDWNRPIDFLFLDGDHTFEAVERDYLDWSPHIVPGGWIAFHDTHFRCPPGSKDWHQGPGRVVRKHVASSPEWTNQDIINTLYLAQRTS